MKIPCHNDDICLPVSAYEPSDAAHYSKKVYSVSFSQSNWENRALHLLVMPGVETAFNKCQGLRQKLLIQKNMNPLKYTNLIVIKIYITSVES